MDARKKRDLKLYLRNLLPVLLLIGVTVAASVMAYHRLMKKEEQQCWQNLAVSASAVNREIVIRMEDNRNLLRMAADSLASEVGNTERFAAQMKVLCSMTIFDRIDVLYPDGTVLMQNGGTMTLPEDLDYPSILGQGEHVSYRRTDPASGKQVLYCLVPVFVDDEPVAVLSAVMECNKLKDYFQPDIYGGNAYACVVDSRDGSFLMDAWHDELGNAFEMTERKRVKGYEDADPTGEIHNMSTGVNAFVSESRGVVLYLYYTPVGIDKWELLLFVPGDVAFAEMYELRRVLLLVGGVELLMLCIYLFYNIRTMHQLVRSQEELHRLSYTDTLTGLYNRNYYNRLLEEQGRGPMAQLGVAYIDLNGMKRVNDEQGHEAGDRLLQTTAEQIAAVFPDKVCRIGGDEFVIIQPEVAEKRFFERLEKLRRREEERGVSISCGAVWAENCTDLEQLLQEADARMYEDKTRYYETHTKVR